MNRREAIRRAALLLGGALSVPTILSAPDSCARKAGPGWKPAALSDEELVVVSRIADILLPRTDTPGALDVAVPAFIDTMLKETYSPEALGHYLEGLREFDAAARGAHAQPFVQLGASQQQALVEQFLVTAIAEERAASLREHRDVEREVHNPEPPAQHTELPSATGKRPFILTTRELTLLGFFTSRPGATGVLQYLATPGAYHGCLTVSQAGNGRRWAT